MEATPINVNGINDLVHSIQHANKFFLDQTQRQVNTALTLRNWVIGHYIVEYEQKGADRAEYGERLIQNLSDRLGKAGIKRDFRTVICYCSSNFIKLILIWHQLLRTTNNLLTLKGPKLASQ